MTYPPSTVPKVQVPSPPTISDPLCGTLQLRSLRRCAREGDTFPTLGPGPGRKAQADERDSGMASHLPLEASGPSKGVGPPELKEGGNWIYIGTRSSLELSPSHA